MKMNLNDMIAEVRNASSQSLAKLAGMTDEDRIATWQAHLDLVRAAADCKQLMEQALVEHLEEAGDITLGDKQYKAGVRKQTKLRDQMRGRTLAWLAEHDCSVPPEHIKYIEAMGDVYLSAAAFRSGACKRIMPPSTMDEFFETVEVPKLKEGDVRKKRVIEHDTRFSTSGANDGTATGEGW